MKNLNVTLFAFILLFVSTELFGQPYLNPKASVEDRVNDLLPRLSTAEKLLYIGGYNSFYIRAISRLKIPEIKMSDGPVGVRTWGKSTAYPAGILAAATWDTALVSQLGHALGKDSRSRGVHILLAPGVNIYRAPMCGRNFEYFGEDPYLAGRMAVNYIRGVQNEGVVATVKHYAVNNQEWDRYNVSSDIDERTLQEIYLPAFKSAVIEGKVGCVMSSYNLVNNVWASHSYHLLTEILKNDWGFTGFVMSDWGATHNAKQAALAGLDIEMPAGDNMNSTNLSPLISSGVVAQSLIDDKVKRILRVLFQFGFFDRSQTLSNIPQDYAPNTEVALNLARGGIVLLKNQANILPLDKSKLKTVAVIGSNATNWITGGGSSWTDPFHYVSVLDGIKKVAGASVSVTYDAGLGDDNLAFESSAFYTDATLATQGLTAQYYKNKTITGAPSNTQIDRHINFNWAANAPSILGFPVDNFSIRWSGFISATRTGDYEFVVRSDDGSRVYINNNLLIDNWKDQAAATKRAIFRMVEGQKYSIKIEYYENGGDAEIRFGYRFIDFNGSSAVNLAKNSDVAIVCIGFTSDLEGEGFDRTFKLPAYQDSLVNAVARANPNTIVVLNAGGNVFTESWIGNAKGLLHAWFPGQEGGTAIAEILFGVTNPSGKLPVSFEKQWEDNPVFNSYYDKNNSKRVKYTEGLMVGYRYYDTKNVEPLFPYGYGLSYTSFNYSNLQITPDATDDPNLVRVSFDLTNSGGVAGSEVAQLYVRPLNALVERPYKELKGFTKIFLNAGETKRVTLALDSASFSYFKIEKDAFGYDAGNFEIQVGGSSKDIRLNGTVAINVTDKTIPEILAYTPTGNMTNSEGFVELRITFSENVFLNPDKKIRIVDYSTGVLHETVDNTRIAGLGTTTVTFTNLIKLKTGVKYYLTVDSAAFIDYHDNVCNGIKDKSAWNLTITTTGINTNTANFGELKLYPNPTKDWITIAFRQAANETRVVDVVDITGRKVDSFTLKTNQNQAEYNCAELKAGIYFIRCTAKLSLVSEIGRFVKSDE